MLMAAVTNACRDAEVEIAEVGCIVVCTSTGYLLPGLSAYVVHDLGLPMNTARYDIVGMGCHAGLNSLSCATNWAHANPGKIAISAGVEVRTHSARTRPMHYACPHPSHCPQPPSPVTVPVCRCARRASCGLTRRRPKRWTTSRRRPSRSCA